MKPLLMFADPSDPRIADLRKAALTLGLPPPRVCSYPEAARGVPDDGGPVRFDSPGRGTAVAELFLEQGRQAAVANDAVVISAQEAAKAARTKGLIASPTQTYFGFAAVLQRIGGQLSSDESTVISNILTTFDKQRTHALLVERRIPVPEVLATPRSFDTILDEMRKRGCPRVFLKLRYGSAGSGVVALESGPRGVRATTTVEMESAPDGVRLFNSRRVRTYRDPRTVSQLVEALLPHRVHVERWMPKDGVGDLCYDLRIVVIAGEPRHAVMRLSASPITNLHLGAERRDAEFVRERIGGLQWERVLDTCRHVGAVFEASLQVAVDVAISPCGRRHWVLEVNSFGDFLRNCTLDGEDTYCSEFRHLYGRAGRREPLAC